jgi:hypothetical protein
MKKKISFILLGVAVTTPCFAGLFDDGYFIQLIAQGVQVIRNGKQVIDEAQKAKAHFEQVAAFAKNPGGWRNILTRGEAALDQISNGSDNVALQRINDSIRASQRVYTEISNQPPTLANMAALSSLSLQQVEAKNQADQLAESLRIDEQIRIGRQHESWGCISCTRRSAK